MKQNKHTPGSWFADGSSIRQVDSGHLLAELYISPSNSSYWHNGELTSNARLISAAPAMLEALEYISNNDKCPQDVADIVLKAIAEARGEVIRK